MANLYFGAGIAKIRGAGHESQTTDVIPVVCVAESLTEAKLLAIESILNNHPTSEGWYDQQVAMEQADDAIVEKLQAANIKE